jgi:very-short-patch-repair endonuclease
MTRLANTVIRTMFYQASPIIFGRAKSLRLRKTVAEKKLWNLLRKKQMLGLRFKAQHPINQFIADFYCHTIRLVIEVDGSSHNKLKVRESDEKRSMELKKFGIELIRFSNDEIFNDIEQVRSKIELKCLGLIDSHLTPPSP